MKKKQENKVSCSSCGKEKFVTNYEIKTKKNFFCNKECYDKFQRGGKENISVSCEVCEKQKEVTPFEYNKSSTKKFYCSKECFDYWQIGKNTKEENPNWKGGKLVYCLNCGSEIWEIPCYEGLRKFCSNDCLYEYKKGKQIEHLLGIDKTGENNPNWRGGSSLEGYDLSVFNKKLKREIKSRDRDKCCLCGISSDKRILMIHHIDYCKNNYNYLLDIETIDDWSKNNLITLCNKCHPKTNFNREYWEKWFHSSSGFFFATR